MKGFRMDEGFEALASAKSFDNTTRGRLFPLLLRIRGRREPRREQLQLLHW